LAGSQYLSAMKEAVDGKLFGTYLYPHSTFESERAGYTFNFDDQDMLFCLATLTKRFGLGKEQLPGLS